MQYDFEFYTAAVKKGSTNIEYNGEAYMYLFNLDGTKELYTLPFKKMKSDIVEKASFNFDSRVITNIGLFIDSKYSANPFNQWYIEKIKITSSTKQVYSCRFDKKFVPAGGVSYTIGYVVMEPNDKAFLPWMSFNYQDEKGNKKYWQIGHDKTGNFQVRNVDHLGQGAENISLSLAPSDNNELSGKIPLKLKIKTI